MCHLYGFVESDLGRYAAILALLTVTKDVFMRQHVLSSIMQYYVTGTAAKLRRTRILLLLLNVFFLR